MSAVWMKYKGDETVDDGTLLACKLCGNKAFLLAPIKGDFPMMECCACRTEIGQIGWIGAKPPLAQN